jgi:hypothetical protein
LPDAVIILVQSASTEGDRRRVLVWTHGTKDGFQRVAQSVGLLACLGCLGMKGGDAAPEVEIKNRVVTITQWGGSRFTYGAVHRFRLEKDGRVCLIGLDRSSNDSVTGKGGTTSTNFLTGAQVVESDEPINHAPGPEPATRKVVKRNTLPKAPLQPLEDVVEYGK